MGVEPVPVSTTIFPERNLVEISRRQAVFYRFSVEISRKQAV